MNYQWIYAIRIKTGVTRAGKLPESILTWSILACTCLYAFKESGAEPNCISFLLRDFISLVAGLTLFLFTTPGKNLYIFWWISSTSWQLQHHQAINRIYFVRKRKTFWEVEDRSKNHIKTETSFPQELMIKEKKVKQRSKMTVNVKTRKLIIGYPLLHFLCFTNLSNMSYCYVE